MRTHKTSKGTELPISLIKGKEYLEVKWRIVWLRDECPDWTIETEMLLFTEKIAQAKATIKNENGRIVAQAHKSETPEGFADYAEKAETGAIGRALAYCGFGTQFCADELDEGKRIVDSGVAPKAGLHDPSSEHDSIEEDRLSHNPGEYKIKIGKKYFGRKILSLSTEELMGYIKYFEDGAKKNKKPLEAPIKEFIEFADAYLKENR